MKRPLANDEGARGRPRTVVAVMLEPHGTVQSAPLSDDDYLPHLWSDHRPCGDQERALKPVDVWVKVECDHAGDQRDRQVAPVDQRRWWHRAVP